jgi:drug/metabolite transporter (DMT)-like permease
MVISPRIQAHLACLGVQTIFSGWNILGSVALNEGSASPMTYTLIRGIGSSILLGSICAFYLKVDPLLPQHWDIPRILLFGMVGGSVMPVFFLFGLQLTTPTVSAIYDGPLMPVVVLILTVGCGIERLPKLCLETLKLIGFVAISVCGAIMIILNTKEEGGGEGGRSRADYFIGSSYVYP